MSDKNFLTFKESGEESVELTYSVDEGATWTSKLRLFLKFLRLQGYVLPVGNEDEAIDAVADAFLFDKEPLKPKESLNPTHKRVGELPPYLKLVYAGTDEQEHSFEFNPMSTWIELLEEFLSMLNKQENGPGYRIDPKLIQSLVDYANLSLAVEPLDSKYEF